MSEETGFVFEKLLVESPAGHESSLTIVVLFTTMPATSAAMKRAAELAAQLNGRISLVVPIVTPYPLPLSSPPVLVSFSERRMRELAAESPVETAVGLCLCRDPRAMLRQLLRRRSLVVLGGRRRWWPTQESRLGRWLQCAGHEVVFVETE